MTIAHQFYFLDRPIAVFWKIKEFSWFICNECENLRVFFRGIRFSSLINLSAVCLFIHHSLTSKVEIIICRYKNNS
jgi:hypothetical protein